MSKEQIGMYDSETGETLYVEKKIDLAFIGNETVVWLRYTRAKRGRICQVERGSSRIHYFIDEPESRKFIAEDQWRNGVSIEEILQHAPEA